MKRSIRSRCFIVAALSQGVAFGQELSDGDTLARYLSGQFLGRLVSAEGEKTVGINGCLGARQESGAEPYQDVVIENYMDLGGKPYSYRQRVYRISLHPNSEGEIRATILYPNHLPFWIGVCYRGVAAKLSATDIIDPSYRSCEMKFVRQGNSFHGKTSDEGCASMFAEGHRIVSQTTLDDQNVELSDLDIDEQGNRSTFSGATRPTRFQRMTTYDAPYEKPYLLESNH